MGCDGGSGSGSGLLWGRRHCWVRARGTRTRLKAQVTRLGARWMAGHGDGGEWLTAGMAHGRDGSGADAGTQDTGKGMAHGCGAGHRRAQSRGGLRGKKMNGTKMILNYSHRNFY